MNLPTRGTQQGFPTSGYMTGTQARQTRPNSGGVAEGHPRFDKGGVAIIFFYFLRVKNSGVVGNFLLWER